MKPREKPEHEGGGAHKNMSVLITPLAVLMATLIAKTRAQGAKIMDQMKSQWRSSWLLTSCSLRGESLPGSSHRHAKWKGALNNSYCFLNNRELLPHWIEILRSQERQQAGLEQPLLTSSSSALGHLDRHSRRTWTGGASWSRSCSGNAGWRHPTLSLRTGLQGHTVRSTLGS